MKALAFSILVLSLTIPLFFIFEKERKLGEQGFASSIAANFMIFRNAAISYGFEHPFPGNMEIASLSAKLPPGYAMYRTWQARIEKEGVLFRLYVWGQATDEEIAAARALSGMSETVGKAENGTLVPVRHNSIPIPAFVQNGSLASVCGLGIREEITP
jgi:hypothetical protein